MIITIELSQDELGEIELDKLDLHDYIIDTIIDDKCDICFPPYDVLITVTQQLTKEQ